MDALQLPWLEYYDLHQGLLRWSELTIIKRPFKKKNKISNYIQYTRKNVLKKQLYRLFFNNLFIFKKVILFSKLPSFKAQELNLLKKKFCDYNDLRDTA